MTRRQLRQSNLTGAAGLVSLETAHQQIRAARNEGGGDENAFIEMGGRDVESSKMSRATVVAIRGF